MTIGLFPILIALTIVLITVAVLCVVVSRRKRGGGSCNTVCATVAAKRTHTSRQTYCKTCAVQPGEMITSYYVTFHSDAGSALELTVPAEDASRLNIGQRGKLTYQGGRYLGFERIN